jgi:hypothetical protein
VFLFLEAQDGGEGDGGFEEREEEDVEDLVEGDVEGLLGGIVCYAPF